MKVNRGIFSITGKYAAASIWKGVSVPGGTKYSLEAICYFDKIGENRYEIMVPTQRSLAMKRQVENFLNQINKDVEYMSTNQGDLKLIVNKEMFDIFVSNVEEVELQTKEEEELLPTKQNVTEVAVDGWTSGNPGPGGWKITDLNGNVLYEKEYKSAHTNNLYEFLGLAAAVFYFHEKDVKVYSDSVTAIAWVKGNMGRDARKKYAEDPLFQKAKAIIDEHKEWVNTHVEKWDTENNGEIPADPGRK